MLKNIDRDIIFSGVLGFQIIIVVYLMWFITNMNSLSLAPIAFPKCKKLDINNPFPTYVYSLLISSARTKKDTLACDKKEFSKNNWQRFVEDIRNEHINTIILAGKAYKIRFQREDKGYAYFKTDSMCSTLQLPACESYEVSQDTHKNKYIKNNISVSIQNLLNQIVHVLGCKI